MKKLTLSTIFCVLMSSASAQTLISDNNEALTGHIILMKDIGKRVRLADVDMFFPDQFDCSYKGKSINCGEQASRITQAVIRHRRLVCKVERENVNKIDDVVCQIQSPEKLEEGEDREIVVEDLGRLLVKNGWGFAVNNKYMLDETIAIDDVRGIWRYDIPMMPGDIRRTFKEKRK